MGCTNDKEEAPPPQLSPGYVSKSSGSLAPRDPHEDRHVSLRLQILFPEEQTALLDEVKAAFVALPVNRIQGVLYAGCAVHDDQELLLRAGFAHAAALLELLAAAKAPFEKAVAAAGFNGFGLCIVGPEEELQQLVPAMGALGTEFYCLEENGRWYNRGSPGRDQHLTLSPFFHVPEGKMDEFRSLFTKFYEVTKQATQERLYYGFGVLNNTVCCRQGYKNAEGILAHLRDVDAVLQEAMAIVGPCGVDLSVTGPPEELEKLRIVLGPYTPKFFELAPQDAVWITS